MLDQSDFEPKLGTQYIDKTIRLVRELTAELEGMGEQAKRIHEQVKAIREALNGN